MISEEYRQEQQKLHENPNYGVASVSFAPIISRLINELGVTELLDYGAGKGRLARSLTVNHDVKVAMYDPGVPELSSPPDSSQMVACIDVLEHIEPEYLDAVLDDLQRCTEFYGFFSVHTGPAEKVLSDGRNAHLIQEDYTWWLPKFWERFVVQNYVRTEHGFYVICTRKLDS